MLTPTGKATKKKSMWRLFLLKLTAGTNPSRHVSKIERFYSCGEQIYKFIGTKELVYLKKSSIPTGLALETTTAAVSLFWGNNVTVVTSYENALGSMSFKDIKLLSIGLLVVKRKVYLPNVGML